MYQSRISQWPNDVERWISVIRVPRCTYFMKIMNLHPWKFHCKILRFCSNHVTRAKFYSNIVSMFLLIPALRHSLFSLISTSRCPCKRFSTKRRNKSQHLHSYVLNAKSVKRLILHLTPVRSLIFHIRLEVHCTPLECAHVSTLVVIFARGHEDGWGMMLGQRREVASSGTVTPEIKPPVLTCKSYGRGAAFRDGRACHDWEVDGTYPAD